MIHSISRSTTHCSPRILYLRRSRSLLAFAIHFGTRYPFISTPPLAWIIVLIGNLPPCSLSYWNMNLLPLHEPESHLQLFTCHGGGLQSKWESWHKLRLQAVHLLFNLIFPRVCTMNSVLSPLFPTKKTKQLTVCRGSESFSTRKHVKSKAN